MKSGSFGKNVDGGWMSAELDDERNVEASVVRKRSGERASAGDAKPGERAAWLLSRWLVGTPLVRWGITVRETKRAGTR